MLLLLVSQTPVVHMRREFVRRWQLWDSYMLLVVVEAFRLLLVRNTVVEFDTQIRLCGLLVFVVIAAVQDLQLCSSYSCERRTKPIHKLQ